MCNCWPTMLSQLWDRDLEPEALSFGVFARDVSVFAVYWLRAAHSQPLAGQQTTSNEGVNHMHIYVHILYIYICREHMAVMGMHTGSNKPV